MTQFFGLPVASLSPPARRVLRRIALLAALFFLGLASAWARLELRLRIAGAPPPSDSAGRFATSDLARHLGITERSLRYRLGKHRLAGVRPPAEEAPKSGAAG